MASQNIITRPPNSAPAAAGGVADFMIHPPCKPMHTTPNAYYHTWDNNILAPSMVSVSKSVSPVNRMPVAIGEEQEGNTLDNDLLFPDLEPDQSPSAESENEVDGASAVDIDNAKSKCKYKTKREFKAQSKADRNTGEEGEQTVDTTFEDSDDEDITHRPVKTKPSHKNTSTHIDQESGSLHKSKTRVSLLKTTPEDSDDELMHPLMNTKKFHKNISTHVDRETTDKSNKSKTRVNTTLESNDEELVHCPMNTKPSHNVLAGPLQIWHPWVLTDRLVAQASPSLKLVLRSDGEDDDDDTKVRHRRIKFTKNDLPAGSHCKFDSYVVPMWIDFISCLDNMWDILDFAEEMQRVYDYHSNFGEQAEIIIAKYIQMQDWSCDDVADIVAYLVPEQAQYVDDAGHTTWVNPPIYPYMWKLVVGDRTNVDSYRGSFKDSCVLDTFALYLEQVHDLPKEFRCTDMQKGALSIAMIAVKCTWKMWSTGVYVKPKRPSESQFAEGLWSDCTELVIESLEQASCRKWKMISKGARPFIDAHQKRPSRRAKAQRKADLTFHLWVDFFYNFVVVFHSLLITLLLLFACFIPHSY
ncbi:hypothetical protein F4604DRAFT_1932326 [Suillus subluteus]|nr:hypothetical protein F4604DRAFT_1932326 [Suillus subluteus]